MEDHCLVVRHLRDGFFRDKMRLPESILELTMIESTAINDDPMIFHIVGSSYYGGVLDFTAMEGVCELPVSWGYDEGTMIMIRGVRIPKMTAVTVHVSQAFMMTMHLDLRTIIEDELKRYSCLWKNRHVQLNDRLSMVVLDVKPADVVCVVDTDANLDIQFEELKPQAKKNVVSKYGQRTSKCIAFSGHGNKMS